MSDHEQKRAPKPMGNPAWRKGGPSPNPRGRPRSTTSLAETIRKYTDQHALVMEMNRLVFESHSEQIRVAAATWLAERGFKKPAQVIEVAQVDAEFDGLTLEELEAEEALARAQLSGEIIDVEIIEEPKSLPAPRTLTLADLEAAEKQRNRDIAFAKKKAKRKS